jgi:hypothetical protein
LDVVSVDKMDEFVSFKGDFLNLLDKKNPTNFVESL